MFDFRGYDANGASTYTQADGTAGPLATASKDVLDKQALPTMNLGLSTSLNMGDWTIATSLYGSFGHYVYNNTDNAYFFKGAYPVRNIPLEIAFSALAITCELISLPMYTGAFKYNLDSNAHAATLSTRPYSFDLESGRELLISSSSDSVKVKIYCLFL